MRKKNQNYLCEKGETQAAFTFAMFLTNVLILIVIVAFAWLAHIVLNDNNLLNAVLRGGLMQ